MMPAAKIIFWSSALMLFYIYAGYPLLLLVVSWFRTRRVSGGGYTPFISILIAACNEEAGIKKKLEQTLELDYPAEKFEVLVLSDGSRDRTDEIVTQFGDPRVSLVRIPERQGKTNAQNIGVRRAKGEILVFSDATTVYHPQALRFLVGNYQDPAVGAVSGRYQYFDERQSPTGTGTIAFWNYENNIKVWQSRIGTLTGCCGCIYSVRRGAYTELAPDIISDLVQPLWVVRQGYRVAFEDRALACEETTESAAEEFSMRVRVITRGMRGLLSVPGLLNPLKHGWVSLQLLSHKVVRWMAPVFWLLLLFSNALLWRQPSFRIFFCLQLSMYLLAALQLVAPLHRRWKVLGVPLYFCTLNAAALFGMFELLRGHQYAVWQPVRRQG